MINKKIAVLFTVLFLFPAFIYAEGKNFVTMLSGANTATSANTKSYSFVGQSLVFDTNDDLNSISRSAFASVLRSYQSSNISFKDNTEQIVFSDIKVPLKVHIQSAIETNIVKVKYQIWQGESNPDWDSITEADTHTVYDDTTGSGVHEYDFKEEVTFSEGQPINYFRVYAELKNKEKAWFVGNRVNISSGLLQGVKFTSPDPIAGSASTNPFVETTEYSINLTTVTVYLYSGSKRSGDDYIYSVELNKENNETLKMYSEDLGKISYTHSDFVKNYKILYPSAVIPEKLTEKATYTLVIKANGKEDYVTFKTVSGGVTNILTYPSPFNPNKGEKIKIRYTLAKKSKVTIRLYDKAGKIVCKLLDNADKSAGTNEDEWNGRNYAGDTLATGAYICEIIAKASDGEHRRYTALAIVGK